MQRDTLISTLLIILFFLSFPFASMVFPSNLIASDFRDNFGFGDPTTSNYTFGPYKIIDGVDIRDVAIVGNKIVATFKLLNDTGFEKDDYLMLLSLDWEIINVTILDDLSLPQFLGSFDDHLVILGRQSVFPFDQYIAVYNVEPMQQIWNVSYTQVKEEFGTVQSDVFPIMHQGQLKIALVTKKEDTSTVSLISADTDGALSKDAEFSLEGSVKGVSVETDIIYFAIDDPFYGLFFYVQKMGYYDQNGYSEGEYKIRLPSSSDTGSLRIFFPVSLADQMGLEILFGTGESQTGMEYRILHGNETLAILNSTLQALPFARDGPSSFRYLYSRSNQNWFIPLTPLKNMLYNETQLIGLYSSDGEKWQFEVLQFNVTQFGPEMQFLGVDYIEDEENGYFVFQANHQNFGALMPIGSGTIVIDLNSDYPSQVRKIQALDQGFLLGLRGLLLISALYFGLRYRLLKTERSEIVPFPKTEKNTIGGKET